MRLELRGGEGAGPLLSIWAQKPESLETRWYPLSARHYVREGARAGQGHIWRAWRGPGSWRGVGRSPRRRLRSAVGLPLSLCDQRPRGLGASWGRGSQIGSLLIKLPCGYVRSLQGPPGGGFSAFLEPPK